MNNYTAIREIVGLITTAATADPEGCLSDDACPSLYNCIDGMCKHKELFPLAPQEYFGAILMSLLVGVANAGGMGGSFIASPILMIIFNYSPLQAIRLVYCVVFGGSLGNFLINFFNRRDQSSRPVIDYDVALIAMPMLLCGTSIGVLLNGVVPPIITIIGLVYVMAGSLGKLWRRALSQAKAERKAGNKKLPECEASTNVESEMKDMSTTDRESYADYYMIVENPRMYQIVQEDNLLFPWRKYREIFLLILLIVSVFLLKGTANFKSILGISYCSSSYWFLYLVSLLMCFVFEKRAREILIEDAEVRERAFIESNSEFRVSSDNISKLRNLSLVGGTLAGFLGIGGGTVMNPRMLDMGLSGQSAAATSGFFVIFTGFISMFQTLLMGGLSTSEVLFFSPLAFVGSLGISLIINYLVKLYKKPSIVMFCLVGTVILGCIAIPTFSLYRSFQYPAMMFRISGVC